MQFRTCLCSETSEKPPYDKGIFSDSCKAARGQSVHKKGLYPQTTVEILLIQMISYWQPNMWWGNILFKIISYLQILPDNLNNDKYHRLNGVLHHFKTKCLSKTKGQQC